MFGNVLSAVILGVDTHKVMVEADISAGLPGFSIVGVSSAQGREGPHRFAKRGHSSAAPENHSQSGSRGAEKDRRRI